MAVATGSPVGPLAATGTRSNPAATSASRVPAPPSPSGSRTTSASGRARRRPASMAAAAWPALRLPSNLSGATTTRMERSLAAPGYDVAAGSWRREAGAHGTTFAGAGARRRLGGGRGSGGGTPGPGRRRRGWLRALNPFKFRQLTRSRARAGAIGFGVLAALFMVLGRVTDEVSWYSSAVLLAVLAGVWGITAVLLGRGDPSSLLPPPWSRPPRPLTAG